MAVQGGFGVVLKIKVSEALTAVAHVEDVDFPEFEKILAESTGHDSTDGWAEYASTGKRKLGEMTATLQWDIAEATHLAIRSAFDSDAAVDMSIADPEGDESIAFKAHIKKLGRAAKQEGVYQCKVSIQPTGKPTITTAS